MLKSLAVTTALTLSLASAAFAQSSSTTPAPSASTTTTTDTNGRTVATTTGPAIESNKLIGRNVINQDNKTVGSIESVILDPQGQVKSVIVGVGGFLGIGQKPVAIDWNQLQIQDNGQRVVMNTTADQLRSMPEYRYPSDQKRGSVYTMRNTGPVGGNEAAPGAYGNGSVTSRTVPGPAGTAGTTGTTTTKP